MQYYFATSPFVIVLCLVVCSESGYTHQRRIAAWIGGSIVSSIQDTYREIKITKQEWDEEKENSILTKSF